MKKLLLLFGCYLLGIAPNVNAQKLETYSSRASYETLGGSTGGTEKYTYKIDERGKKIPHGTYNYSGKNQYENSDIKLQAQYSISANYKDGYLHGNLAVSGDYKFENYAWLEGWKRTNANTKLTGVFKNGKPSGTFNITYNGESWDGSAYATLSNGKYIGNYSFNGLVTNERNYTFYYEIKGQLTQDGKLTGKWVYDTQLNSYNMTFINDVLISETSEKTGTTPRLQEVAKRYANNNLTKEQVEAMGFLVREDYLPLHYIVYEYILLPEFNLYKMPGHYDCSAYCAKQYTRIIELNTLTPEVYDMLKERLLQNTKDIKGNEDPKQVMQYSSTKNSSIWCDFKIYYDNKFNAPCFYCSSYFTETYGTLYKDNALEDQFIFLTQAQFADWSHLLDSIAKSHKRSFEDLLLDAQLRDVHEAYQNYRRMPKEEWLDFLYKESHDSFNKLRKNLNEYVEEIDNDLLKFFRYKNYEIEFSHDSTCVVNPKHYLSSYSIEGKDTLRMIQKSVNEVAELYDLQSERKQQILAILKQSSFPISEEVYREEDNKSKSILEKIEKQNIILEIRDLLDSINTLTPAVTQALEKYSPIKSNFLQKNRSFQYKIDVPTITWLDIENKHALIQNHFLELLITQEYINLRDSIEDKNTLVRSQLSPNALKNYDKIYKKNNTKQLYTNWSFDSVFDNLFIVQEGYLAWEKRHETILKNNETLAEQVIPFKDFVKVYPTLVMINDEPIMQNAIDVQIECNKMDSVINQQEVIFDYLENRKKVNQLHLEITDVCKSNKGCAKAYKTLCKHYVPTWNPKIDNFASIKNILEILLTTKEAIQNQNALPELDRKLKKVKGLEDVKSILGINH